MIDRRLFRTDLAGVRAALARRLTEVLVQLDEAVALDERARIVTAERDDARRRVNELSKQVGQLRRAGDVDKADLVMAESRAVGDAEAGLAAELADVEQELRELLLRIPNLPSDLAPDGLSEADNPVVKGPINLPDTFPAHQRVPTGRRPPPWASSTTSGPSRSAAMFTMQRGLGATLSRALCQLALDRNADAFEEIRPPTLVTTATLTATGQLPKFADDALRSSATTSGASPPPRSRSRRSAPGRSSPRPICPCA